MAASSQLQVEIKTLTLNEPFRIAHGTSAERQVLRVRYGTGIGEAPFVPYYHDDPAESLHWLQTLPCDDLRWLPEFNEGPRPARLALDILLHDLHAKEKGLPLWMELSAPNPTGVIGCRSMSIPTDLQEFRDKVREIFKRFGILKLKLGSGNVDFDEAIVASAREAAPEANLFADVNGGWKNAEAAAILPKLPKYRLNFVEQPIHHREGLDGWRELRAAVPKSSSLPLYADESAQGPEDVGGLADLVDGINVKLLKCGSLGNALEMIRVAKRHRLKVLVGCMIESSIGTTAAAHLAGLVDGIDLDGHLYVANDDWRGISYDDAGKLMVPEGAGLAVERV